MTNGADAWAARGIAGRGILIDYHSWARRNNIQYDRLSTHAIDLDAIKSIIEESKVEVRKGDIMLLRTGKQNQSPGLPNIFYFSDNGCIAVGFVEAYTRLGKDAKESYKDNNAFPGLWSSKEIAQWLWKSQFAAVAADSPAFECLRKCISSHSRPCHLSAFIYSLSNHDHQHTTQNSVCFIQSSSRAGGHQ